MLPHPTDAVAEFEILCKQFDNMQTASQELLEATEIYIELIKTRNKLVAIESNFPQTH